LPDGIFSYKNPNFGRPGNIKVWDISPPFGILHQYLVYAMDILYTVWWRFGIRDQGKSVNHARADVLTFEHGFCKLTIEAVSKQNIFVAFSSEQSGFSSTLTRAEMESGATGREIESRQGVGW
jgi:hypothetical protein